MCLQRRNTLRVNLVLNHHLRHFRKHLPYHSRWHLPETRKGYYYMNNSSERVAAAADKVLSNRNSMTPWLKQWRLLQEYLKLGKLLIPPTLNNVSFSLFYIKSVNLFLWLINMGNFHRNLWGDLSHSNQTRLIIIYINIPIVQT